MGEDRATERSSQLRVSDWRKICSLCSESVGALQSPRKLVEIAGLPCALKSGRKPKRKTFYLH